MSKASGLALLIVALIMASIVSLQPTIVEASPKTIVVPDDYSTMQEAVNGANNGDTILLKAGTYDGPINQTLAINKTLNLLGESPENTKINLHPLYYEEPYFTVTRWIYQPPIAVNTDNFLMSGFTVQSPGGDIRISGDKNRIINNTILSEKGTLNISGNGTQVIDNNITLFNLSFAGSNHYISKNNLILTGGWPGVSCKGSFTGFIANNVSGAGSVYVEGPSNLIWGNTITIKNGLDVDGTGNIIAKNGVNILITLGTNNVVYGNTISNGLSIISSNSILYANEITLANTIVWKTQANNVLYQNNFRGTIEIAPWNRQENGTDYWDNGVVGNYWSTYKGSDLNNDDIGDASFVVDANNIDRYPLMEPFNVKSASWKLPDWANSLLNPSTFASVSPTPTPTVPELSWLIIMPLLVSTFVAVVLRLREQVKKL